MILNDFLTIQQDDSDDEDEEKDEVTNIRKKKRARRKRPPKQHWVLQSNEEFIQKMKIKKAKAKDPEKGALFEAEYRAQLSNRYEGVPESNNSQYILLSSSSAKENSGTNATTPSISVMPLHGYISFTQPAKFKTLSMHDAENAIASKNVSRYMMHGTLKNSNGENNSMMGNRMKNVGKSRLLESLMDNGKDEEDDTMADLGFREKKSGVSVQTRQELLSDFADGDIKVDHDGILGGANDAEFAGGRRFGQMKRSNKKRQNEGDPEKRGKNDGAIEDDFYQQDVGAQFDNVDCDLDALFDNNDEYMGAGAQDDYDLGGFADVEDEESDMEEDDDFDVSAMGTKSFATKTGMKAIIAKANGENIDIPTIVPPMTMESKAQRRSGNLSSGSDRSEDEKESHAPKRKSPDHINGASAKENAPAPKKPRTTVPAVNVRQVDEHGLRIISKDAVRREIWLHNCSIPTTQLFKKFKAHGKKFKDRRKVLLDICLELCTMEGDLLTLKPHFAKM